MEIFYTSTVYQLVIPLQCMKKILYVIGILVFMYSCQNNASSSESTDNSWLTDSLTMDSLYGSRSNTSGVLDSVLPFFAKRHDSIPAARRFDTTYSAFFAAQKKDRQYSLVYTAATADSFSYFLIRRLEPSIKNDKYAALCGRFKRLSSGAIDTATYEELFWTWKMPFNELNKKSVTLFKAVIQGKDLKPYIPGKENDLYIMFPDANVSFNTKSKTWMSKSEF
jgi:hypothetical protein